MNTRLCIRSPMMRKIRNEAHYHSPLCRGTRLRISEQGLRRGNTWICQSSASTCKLVVMPELPDIAAYITALETRIVGEPFVHVRLASPFLLRSIDPMILSVAG